MSNPSKKMVLEDHTWEELSIMKIKTRSGSMDKLVNKLLSFWREHHEGFEH